MQPRGGDIFRHFLGFKILNFNIFGVFGKKEYFLGGTKIYGYFMGSFLRSRYGMGVFFGR